MSAPILSVKLKNAFKALPDSDKYAMEFKNININGNKRGCSGFITNLENDVCVYINTESIAAPFLGILYRYCEQSGEYTGGHNHFAKSLDEVVHSTVHLLADPQRAECELAAWGKHYKGNAPVEKFVSTGLDKHGNHTAEHER